MNLHFTLEEAAFRAEVRTFVHAHLPAAIQHKVQHGQRLTKTDYQCWHQILYAQGWATPGWPAEHGGPGWNSVQQFIFEEECAAAGAPRTVPFGPKMVAPVIMRFGTPEQQQRFLPPILRGEAWWCQGYSEPGAGSDLASVKTRAVRQADHFLVNGQKTWTTLAQYADWIFCLVRSDPLAKAQRGISFLLIDMRSPGVSVRPIITMDGAHEVNEVWFDEVKVPLENLIGEEHQGWTYAKFLLGHERSNIAGIGIAKRELARLKRVATQEWQHGKPLCDDALFAHRVAQIEIDLMALEITNFRVLADEANLRAPGPEASILKIKGTEIQQAISELLMQALGGHSDSGLPPLNSSPDGEAQSEEEEVLAHYLNLRKLSIFGGSNEIQKNIIAQMMLRL